MKIVYMGTPDFSVGALEAIIAAGHEVALVVTQPDKQKGRGKEVQYPPVKTCALKHGIEVFQPVKIKEADAVSKLRSYQADVFVIAAFGQFLSQEILDMPRYGCINIHASLLPKYRGAAPIQWAIIDGETKSGVTIMQMAKGIDTGDMLLSRSVDITPEETGETLHDKLSALGAELIVEALVQVEAGTVVPVKQDDSLSCYASRLEKTMGKIDFQKDAITIERLIRGLNAWPSAYAQFHGKTLKIWKAKVVEQSEEVSKQPGTILEVGKDFFTVQTGNGSLAIMEVQLEGKKRMLVKDFLLGYPMTPGESLSFQADQDK